MNTSIVVGASSAIAQAVIRQLAAQGENVIAISRQPPNSELANLKQVMWLKTSYDDDDIQTTCTHIVAQKASVNRVLMFHGLLHNETMFPEKQLRELSRPKLQWLFEANAIIPMLWLQGLTPLLKQQKHPVTVSVCSARVGSISDNRLGGWYGYRASKAALNMFLKTTAIEFKRALPHVKLIAFHPGTTDTPLSKPFQHRVPAGQLFTPDYVAERLLDICKAHHPDGVLAYLDWQGKSINW